MHILVVEDDMITARSLRLMLEAEGDTIKSAGTGLEALDLAINQSFDAIILDLSLPDIGGQEVLGRLRTLGVVTPVIILTGDGELQSKVIGLGGGADDYVTKPFQRDELLARINAVVRRSVGKASSIVTTGAMTIDLSTRTTEVNGHRVHMTPREYKVLELLALRKGLPVPKEMIFDHLYAGGSKSDPRIVDVFVCKIRRRLSEADVDASGYVETVWGHGYVLRDPEARLPHHRQAA